MSAIALALLPLGAAQAQDKKYGPGVTDAEIVIGQTMPYTGPVSFWGANGRADVAYFEMVNADGGVNGRKLVLHSEDDGYSPPKALEQVRKLVEQTGVAFIYRSLGTATNSATAKYLNDSDVPQLLIASGASKWNDPANLPWTLTSQMTYGTEAALYARHIMDTMPNAKVAVLYQNDDFGKDFLSSFNAKLGDKASSMIVKALSYEATDPTIDPQVLEMQAAGADVLMLFSTAKHAAQAIRKSADLGWKPQMFISNLSANIPLTFKPAGLENAKGIITAQFFKDPIDPQWKDDPEVAAYNAWMDKYLPGQNKADLVYPAAFGVGSILMEILRSAGDDLTRENIMAKALSLNEFKPALMIPGITVTTTPEDHRVFKAGRLVRFNGEIFETAVELVTDN